MKNIIIELAGTFPVLLQNTHLDVNLQGWPAAVAVIAISISGVSAYVIRVMTLDSVKTISDTRHSRMAI